MGKEGVEVPFVSPDKGMRGEPRITELSSISLSCFMPDGYGSNSHVINYVLPWCPRQKVYFRSSRFTSARCFFPLILSNITKLILDPPQSLKIDQSPLDSIVHLRFSSRCNVEDGKTATIGVAPVPASFQFPERWGQRHRLRVFPHAYHGCAACPSDAAHRSFYLHSARFCSSSVSTCSSLYGSPIRLRTAISASELSDRRKPLHIRAVFSMLPTQDLATICDTKYGAAARSRKGTS